MHTPLVVTHRTAEEPELGSAHLLRNGPPWWLVLWSIATGSYLCPSTKPPPGIILDSMPHCPPKTILSQQKEDYSRPFAFSLLYPGDVGGWDELQQSFYSPHVVSKEKDHLLQLARPFCGTCAPNSQYPLCTQTMRKHHWSLCALDGYSYPPNAEKETH